MFVMRSSLAVLDLVLAGCDDGRNVGRRLARAADRNDGDEFAVDMEWTCGIGAPTVSQPLGYKLDLGDVGCDAVQNLTLRYATGPDRVIIEQYGNPNYRHVAPVLHTNAGEAFKIEFGHVSIDAVLTEHTAQGAEIDINHIEWAGVEQCTPGVYALGLE